MASFLENVEKLNLPKPPPLVMPASVLEVASRLGLTLRITCSASPEQYEVLKGDTASGYIRVRHGGMRISYPEAGDEDLYHGSVEGFGGFTEHEREAKLLFALGLIAARMMGA